MSNQVMINFNELSAADLNIQIEEVKKQIFELRMMLASGQTVQTHKFKSARKKIARMSTVLSNKKREELAND